MLRRLPSRQRLSQCGFSSTVHGNDVAVEAQRAKLAPIVEVADEVRARASRARPASCLPRSGSGAAWARG